MTLHNLGDHISWLLQRRQIPPAGPPYESHEADTEHVEITDEEPLNSVYIANEASEQQSITTFSAQAAPNVAPEFVQAAIPSTVQESELARKVGNSMSNTMAKLSSASKPAGPTLLSQRQLATPASTTGSLSAAWTASFHKDG
jgi:hypothetical protein